MIAAVAVAVTATRLEAARNIQEGTLIHLADGDVQGEVERRDAAVLGIPYAAPPVGALRWRPPAPAIPWQGVVQANAFAPACAQLASIQGGASDTEDCLDPNVWTPNPGACQAATRHGVVSRRRQPERLRR